MFIHLEDWTHPMFLSQIERRGIPHRNRFIKAFSTELDPRQYTHKPIQVFESSGLPFQDEVYSYDGRDTFTGSDLERYVQQLMLSRDGQRVVRSLFRFANDQVGIIPNIMKMQDGNEWIFIHPFEEIDGIRELKKFNGDKERDIHIDIFHPQSLKLLGEQMDLEHTDHMLTFREGRSLRRLLSAEGVMPRSKER